MAMAGPSSRRPAVLAIAATDSSGGAGLTRDVQVLSDLRVDALCVITAVTAQSDRQVIAVHHVPPQIIRAQMAAALQTRPINAIKIGMLGTRAAIEAVVDSLPSPATSTPADEPAIALVVDPVLVSSSGGILLDPHARSTLVERLFPRATLITPNVPEAAALLGEPPATRESELIAQGQRLLRFGSRAVLLKGGHGDGENAVDVLICAHTGVERIVAKRVNGTCRGTGCALASAIAAGLAAGQPLSAACRQAKHYVLQMLTPVGQVKRPT